MKSIETKKIVILGLSCSGYAAAILALKKKARVFVTEILDNKQMSKKAKQLIKQGAIVELGGHTRKFFQAADFFITSPGIKKSAFPLKWAKKNKVDVFSEIEFASWFTQAPIVAITGSNGKTTVTQMIGNGIRSSINVATAPVKNARREMNEIVIATSVMLGCVYSISSISRG